MTNEADMFKYEMQLLHWRNRTNDERQRVMRNVAYILRTAGRTPYEVDAAVASLHNNAASPEDYSAATCPWS